MLRRESRRACSTCLAAGVSLFLVLLSGTRQAFQSRAVEVRTMAETVPQWGITRNPISTVLEVMFCARCDAASATVVQNISGQGGWPEKAPWQERSSSFPDITLLVATGGGRARLPVHIAFCRWLH